MSNELSWDEVKARSMEHIEGIGQCFCWDCDLNYQSVKMPCAKHCVSDEERSERDRRFGEKLSGTSYRRSNPVFGLLPRRTFE